MAKSSRRSRKTARRYSWALRLKGNDARLRWLSPAGREGLGYARRLAERARERRLAALDGGIPPVAFTVADLAEEAYTSPIRINTQIKRARIDLFGKDLTDSAIYYRLRHPPPAEQQQCAEPDCPNRIPRHAPKGRRYCADHSTSAAYVRRHREQHQRP